MARPSDYTPETAAKICERLATGESLRSICRDEAMPSRPTIVRWLFDQAEFRSQYAQAKATGIDEIAEQAIEIADTPRTGVIETDKQNRLGEDVTEVQRRDMTEHRRLQVDTRKWYVGKVAPKIYGERVAHEHSGPDGGPIEIDDRTRAAKIEAIFAAAARLRDSGADLV